MIRSRDFCLAVSLALSWLALLASLPAAAQENCAHEAAGAVRVTSVRDDGTLMLGDGRELRLAAIEVPPGAAARSALQALTADQTLTLKRAGAGEDRYGRVVAFAALPDGRTMQQILLSQGLARVGVRAGDKACAAELLKAEAVARAEKRGLWADPNFALLPAESSTRISAEKGRFAVVEGKVLSVRESGGTIYVNFGHRWSRDFSLTISRRNRRTFASAGIEPKTLEGKRVRVRGWIEQRRGPIIEAARPEQIEIAE